MNARNLAIAVLVIAATTAAIVTTGNAEALKDSGSAGEASRTPSVSEVSRTPGSSTRSINRSGEWRAAIKLTCSRGKCAGSWFPASGTNVSAVTTHLSCYARVTGGVAIEAYAQFTSAATSTLTYLFDLGLEWERKVGTVTRYNFGKSSDFYTTPAESVKMNIFYTGTMNEAYCVATGEYQS